MLIFECKHPFPRTPLILGQNWAQKPRSGRAGVAFFAIFSIFRPKIGPEGNYLYFFAKKFNPVYRPHFLDFRVIFNPKIVTKKRTVFSSKIKQIFFGFRVRLRPLWWLNLMRPQKWRSDDLEWHWMLQTVWR